MSLLLAFALLATAERLPPVDTCGGDAAFDDFRQALTGAVERRDMESLLGLMSDDIRVSFGGRYGKEQFRAYWQTGPANSGQLWDELSEVLRLGCAVEGDARVFPSMFVQTDGLDGFSTWIARPGARLRRSPSLRGRIIARLSWHVLEEDGDWDGGDWIRVRLADGRRGYVHRTAARSPIDYRLFANKRDGRWRITSFVAGD